MRSARHGFTMIELVIALLIGSILTSIALGSFRNVQARFSARAAQQMYATLHQRARAIAIEKGETVLLQVDVAGDSAYIVRLGTGISDVTRFRPEFNVDLRSTYSQFNICMTPRGYADYNCGAFSGLFTSTTNAALRLEFWMNADSTSLVILPMGQLVGL